MLSPELDNMLSTLIHFNYWATLGASSDKFYSSLNFLLQREVPHGPNKVFLCYISILIPNSDCTQIIFSFTYTLYILISKLLYKIII